MQFTKPFKQAISAGEITTSFRAWKSPHAKAGGRYNIPPYGAIEVSSVRRLTLAQVRAKDLAKSGFTDRDALAAYLQIEPQDNIYQVDFKYLNAEPVNVPATTRLSTADLDDITMRLQRMDKRTGNTGWTQKTMAQIAGSPGTRAADLAEHCNMDTPTFKRQVRKLKALGLTFSLGTGYRLSPRGEQVHEYLSKTS